MSLKVPQGAIVALLGANGAGKSTTLNVISRLVAPTAGGVRFAGEAIHRLPARRHRRTRHRAGARRPRDLPRHERAREPGNGRLPAARPRRHQGRPGHRLRHLPRLRERLEQKAATLSGGEQQMLATYRAMMVRPRMILLDEPSMGLSPLVVEQIFEIILRLNREQGITILLVEQNVKLALSVSSYAYILENGELALEGESAALAEDEAVQKAYLG
ncbi:ATP-binding cassette domain-containing protein [Achromobacter xylosoxidans]